MTAILDRDVITADQRAAGPASPLARHGSAAADRRASTRARGVSPRLARSRADEVGAVSLMSSNDTAEAAVRTESGEVRVTGARGSARRTVERPGVRSAARRGPRGASRAGGCAQRRSTPSITACVLFAAGAFAVLLVLFGGAPQPESAPAASPAGVAQPALTSVVTVRSGQSLEQIAREIAPERSAAAVVAEITEINGLEGGRIHPGQTLVTPRY